jgi:hypothetical protein
MTRTLNPSGHEPCLGTELLYFSERDHREVSVPFVMGRSSAPVTAFRRVLLSFDPDPAIELSADDTNQLVKVRENACLDFGVK